MRRRILTMVQCKKALDDRLEALLQGKRDVEDEIARELDDFMDHVLSGEEDAEVVDNLMFVPDELYPSLVIRLNDGKTELYEAKLGDGGQIIASLVG